MARTIADRIERLEDDAIDVGKALVELAAYRDLSSKTLELRVVSVEHFMHTAEQTIAGVRGGYRTAITIGGVLMALLTLAVGILALKGA